MGTGFSYVQNDAYATSLAQVGTEFLYFLREFVAAYPEYDRQRHLDAGPGGAVDVYIAGESYAGQFIPYIADALVKAGQNNPVHLAGIAIGNGDLDPKHQGGSEVDMMLAADLWKPDGPEMRAIAPTVQQCRDAVARDATPKAAYAACDAVLPQLLSLTTRTENGTQVCLNTYDLRLVDTSPACGMNWPPELAATYAFLRKPAVRKALHVDDTQKPQAWVECNTAVGHALQEHAAQMDASVALLPGLLEAHVPVLLFAGDQDVICNAIGLQRTVDALAWGGQRGLASAPRDWRINGELVGTWQSDRNLTWVKVHQASHMPAYDAPLAVHDMMLRFMQVDMNLGAGVAAWNTSTVGLDARILVPDRGKTHVPMRPPPPGPPAAAASSAAASVAPSSAAASSAAPSVSPTPTPAQGAVEQAAHVDVLGNVFVLALIGVAVAGCLWVRRRARMRPQRYHAVGQYVLDPGAGEGRVPLRSPPRSPERDVEMEPFALGDDEDGDAHHPGK